MGNNNDTDSMLDVYIFEAGQLIEHLEEILLETEKNADFSSENINEIFRIMHTIKGSSAMMEFDAVSKLAHSVEDLFFFIRENKPEDLSISTICDLVLSASDFIKHEVAKISEGKESDGNEKDIAEKIKDYLALISKSRKPAVSDFVDAEPQNEENQSEAFPYVYSTKYIVKIYFEEGGQMENLRAYTITRNLKEFTDELYTYPEDLINTSSEFVLENGVIIFLSTQKEQNQLRAVFEETLFLKSYEMSLTDSYDEKLKEYCILALRNISPRILKNLREKVKKFKKHRKQLKITVSRLKKLQQKEQS